MNKKPDLIIGANPQWEKVNFWAWIQASALAGINYSAN